MYSTRAAGFSVTRLLVITLIIFGVVAAVCTIAYFVLKEQRVASAQLFTNTIITDITSGDTVKTFDNLDSSLKPNESTAYYSWLFWSSSFAENKITINTQATDTSYTNATVNHLFSDGSVVTVTYATSESSKLSLTVVQQAEGWKVLNYASI